MKVFLTVNIADKKTALNKADPEKSSQLNEFMEFKNTRPRSMLDQEKR